MAIRTSVTITYNDTSTDETYTDWNAEFQSGVFILSRETVDMSQENGKFETMSFPLHRINKITSTTEKL